MKQKSYALPFSFPVMGFLEVSGFFEVSALFVVVFLCAVEKISPVFWAEKQRRCVFVCGRENVSRLGAEEGVTHAGLLF
jgi:hypothetical protein